MYAKIDIVFLKNLEKHGHESRVNLKYLVQKNFFKLPYSHVFFADKSQNFPNENHENIVILFKFLLKFF